MEKLKAIVIARGGGVTGRDGRAIYKEQLQRIVRVYLSMEIKNTRSTVYFNRERVGNGIFAAIDTSKRQTVPNILAQLVNCREFEPSLQRFFVGIKGIMADGGFIGDY